MEKWGKPGMGGKAAALWLVIIAVPLLPVLYIPVMGESVFSEGYLYLPSVGFVVLLAVGIRRLGPLLPVGRGGAAAAIILAALLGLYSVGTLKRVPVWKSNRTLFIDMTRKAPDHAYPLVGLANTYYVSGEYKDAIKLYERAVEIDPDHPAALSNLGISYAMVHDYPRALHKLEQAIRLMPDAVGFYNLGLLYEKFGRKGAAINMYGEAVRLKPGFTEAAEALKEAEERYRRR